MHSQASLRRGRRRQQETVGAESKRGGRAREGGKKGSVKAEG